MPITDEESRKVARVFAEELFVSRDNTANLDLEEIRAAVSDLTDFIEGNATAINNAFPEPFKSEATLAQKRYVLALAAMKLAGLL